METRTFFSDESDNYTAYDRNGKTVRVLLRTGRYQARRVTAVCGGRRFNMKWDHEKNDFDFYAADLPLQEGSVSYYFEIETVEGNALVDRVGAFFGERDLIPFQKDRNYIVPSWAHGAVMYQVFVDRFANGDVSNDVQTGDYTYLEKPVRNAGMDHVPETLDVGNFCGGDLQGLMEKLDYLADLGVSVLYLNPVFVSPSSHKYDVQDYDHIDPHFGVLARAASSSLYARQTTDPASLAASDALFAKFVENCHKRGIRVILDGVFNHCSSLNQWMDREGIYQNGGAFGNPDSPYHSYFVFEDEACETYECWWDHKSLPKLNYEGSKALCEAIFRIAEKWVSPPFSADGWRLDVAADLGHSEEFNHRFWREFRNRVKKANPDAVIIAEHYGDPSSWLNGREWDTVMNYSAFMEPVSWFFTGMEKHSDYFNPELFGNSEETERMMTFASAALPYPALTSAMNQLDNHDHSRFLTRTSRIPARLGGALPDDAGKNIRKSVLRQAVLFLMTWPGSPCIYYGDEAGLCGFTDPDSRRPFPWGREDEKLVRFYRECAEIRRSYDVIKTGSTRFLTARGSVLSFARFTEDEQLIAVFNASDTEREAEIPVWVCGRAGYLKQDDLTVILTSAEGGYSRKKVICRAEYGILKYSLPPHAAVLISGKEGCE